MNEVSVPEEMRREIEQKAQGGTGGLLARIADRLGGSATVSAVYGEPIVREGVTVIPVARVAVGLGGGGGSGSGGDGSGSGEGGGGGATASPIGYIEIREGRAEFQQIREFPPFWVLPPLILASGIATSMMIRALRRLIRG